MACVASFGGSAAATEPIVASAVEQPGAEALAAARDLWTGGLELEKSKDWAGALEKFVRVGQVRMTPQVRYHIAFCSEHVGKFVDAMNGYQLALQEARAFGDKARDVAENTPPRIEAVRDRVAKLRVHVEGTLRTSIVLLDGKKLSTALLDQEIPVDPGMHVVEVARAGTVIDRQKITFDEGASQTVEFQVDDPVAVEVAPRTPNAWASPKPEAPSRLPAYLTAGAGAALLVGAGVTYFLREQTIANIRLTCANGDSGCDPDYTPTEELGRMYTTASRVLLGVGGAAVATGVTLWFVLAPDDGEAAAMTPAEPQLSVGLSPTIGGAVLHGSF